MERNRSLSFEITKILPNILRTVCQSLGPLVSSLRWPSVFFYAHSSDPYLSLFPTRCPFFRLLLSSTESPCLVFSLSASVSLSLSSFAVLPGPSLPSRPSPLPNFSRAPSTTILLFYQLFLGCLGLSKLHHLLPSERRR